MQAQAGTGRGTHTAGQLQALPVPSPALPVLSLAQPVSLADHGLGLFEAPDSPVHEGSHVPTILSSALPTPKSARSADTGSWSVISPCALLFGSNRPPPAPAGTGLRQPRRGPYMPRQFQMHCLWLARAIIGVRLLGLFRADPCHRSISPLLYMQCILPKVLAMAEATTHVALLAPFHPSNCSQSIHLCS